MNSRTMMASMLKTGIAAGLLLLAGGEALAASTVTLTATPTRTALPDGQSVPMWGYACGTGPAAPVNATCTAANGAPQTGVTPTGGWQPPLITVPKGSLTINLVNNLSFQNGNTVPTSLVIVGQLGGGLGSTPVRMDPVTHAPQGTTWPGTLGDTADAAFTPPTQVGRVRSFGTEVLVSDATGKALVWSDLAPGTYLIESGTEPSIQGAMGLYGVLVVTDTDNPGKAYGQAYDKDAALLFSEIDPLQNAAVNTAVNTAGFDEKLVWNGPVSNGVRNNCGDPAVHTCYPPAVNYDPRYYLINGVSFDRSKLDLSTLTILAPVSPATTTPSTSGVVLLRLVNAGLRMHVPAVVGTSMALLAEDGNKLPGIPKVQDEVFLSAGKAYDVAIQPQVTGGNYVPHTFPVFDRALNLSTNNARDGGMQAFLSIGGGAAAGAVGSSASANAASAVADAYNVVPGKTLTISDPAKGLISNDSGIYGVAVLAPVAGLNLNSNGTFTYTGAPTSFTYCGNGVTSAPNAACATVTLDACTGACLGGLPTAGPGSYTSTVSSQLKVAPPGVLAFATSPGNLPLTASNPGAGTCGSVSLNADGSFAVTPGASPSSCSFPYNVATATGQASSAPGTITVNFLAGNGMTFTVKDAKSGVAITDYRWIIEEDRTFWIDPKCQVNSSSRPADCGALPVESLGYSFHTANMPVVAEGCQGSVSCETGQTMGGTAAVCDVGNGACRTDSDHKIETAPGDVYLDPTKRYFISVLPGDGVNPVVGGSGGPDETTGKPFTIEAACGPYTGPTGAWEPAGDGAICGHAMGGVQISKEQVAGKLPVTVKLQETPLPTAKLSVFVFQDDFPLNGENDAGGGVDVLAPNEPGLGGFEIKIFDQAGGLGDATGQVTYDQFNMPLSNSLAGKIDPITGLDACPITARGDRLVGMIPSCPKFESDGTTLSPLAGQVVVANLFPGIYEVTATPAADRIARGEEWLQTNTLDGGKPHEAFLKPDEPGYFQEFGPGGFHVSIGFANPKIINERKAAYCSSALNAPNGACNHSVTVQITNNHLSRTPDQRTFSSDTYDHYGFTQCYVSIGEADAEDFAIEKCDANGKATFTNMPNGVFKLAVFDQWNDIMLDGLVSTISINGDTTKTFPVTQWRTNLYTRTYFDKNGNGVSDDGEAGLALVNTNIRYRDGSIGFFNNTDLDGYAGFNEVFPFMNWLVVDTTNTRYKPTGVHAVYDAGGQVDCSTASPTPDVPCSNIARNLANTGVRVALPAELRVPGAKYCDKADCPASDALGGNSTGTIFPAQPFGTTQGWQGLLGQDTFIEFGVRPFKENENGGIAGDVIYASTRPFDDPSLSLQLSWEPGVPRVTVNLYQKSVDANGIEHLNLVDTTKTASWDDWAQGFRRDAGGNLMTDASGAYIPNMNCPGQSSDSPFFATLKDSKQYLDPDKKSLSHHSQFKCYDGWSQLNQVQPAPYDGRYVFPSMTRVNPANGKSAGTNCSICSGKDADGNPMLPPGKYVVEVILPQGYELVKEEDKNILLGDVFIAPVTQQFAGLGNVFIMPDQAAVNEHYNPNNPGSLNLTTNLGANPRHEGDTGSVESFWPCVGTLRTVPDLNSLYPDAGQAAPFAGAERRLCDRKEVVLEDQASVLAKFFVFSSTHIAGHFTGLITNDFASEFDPFSPQFGEKFGPPNLPVAMRDFTGNEVARVYSDQWGVYNGLYYSSYSVNPPNPTGYVPQMSIACMNDPGQGVAADGTPIVDPAYNPAYSDFCYETPFMPGFTAYMDTPVIPTQSFADGYNLPDTEYPDGTPAIKSVVNTNAAVAQGPWVKPGIPAVAAKVAITIAGVNRCQNGNCVNPSSLGSVTVGATLVTTGAITCVQGGNNPSCSSSSQSTRNNNMAQSLTDAINAHSGVSGYTAARSNAVVTVTANATGPALNGTAVTVNVTNMTSPGLLALAGGAASIGGDMGITITALGAKVVQNPNFSGPNASTAPYNQKTITRHYDFGDSAGSVALVGTDGVVRPLTGVSWSNNIITGTVPDGLPNCGVAQRNQPAGQPAAKCGELVITKADGKQSIDAITVTVGGSTPWIVTPTAVQAPAGKSTKDYTHDFGRLGFSPIQTAIDSADPGDLILVSPGAYRENLIMWKPVRLQGVGAASVVVNADAHPAGKMDQWRRQVNCVFGLDLDGVPNLNDAAFDKDGIYSCPRTMHQRVDRIPFEAIIGWDASGNGNLAQVLQEPTLMGAYEGAGITVLGRGVRIPNNSSDFWGVNATGGAGAFTDGSVYLGSGNADCNSNSSANGRDYGTSNFFCNPSSIDGISVINSSQGGGGLFIHGWGHNLAVGNTRISGNHGTLAGAINLGNGEIPDAYINDGVGCGVNPPVMPCPPIPNGTATNAAIPFQFNVGVRIHHNMLYNNASIGDALFSGTPAGAGAITISSGGDNYQIDHNWIAGNLSTGDGGGLQHLGLSFNGRISNNYILFNQSTNPTLPTNGGGVVIEGANLDRLLNGVECGSTSDQDCPPGLGEGTGPGLVLDANLILGNSAESGSGGGVRIQQVNASELVAFPTQQSRWYDVTVTNNVIANNVAGWDGGGVSMQDAFKVTLANNTIASNDTTASAGVLFKTLGAIYSASPPPGCTPTTDPTQPQNPNCTQDNAQHGVQPAGLVVMANTPNLVDALNDILLVTCPQGGFGYTGIAGINGDCRKLSKPSMSNNLFFHNRTFSVDIVGAGSGLQSQQNLVALTPALNQATTGACAAGANYWDVGLRTDDLTGGLIPAGTKLTMDHSIVSGDPQGVINSSTNRPATADSLVAPFCNGARMPPEHCTDAGVDQNSPSCKGFNAPPGASETTSLSQVFTFNNIQPTATVDEGHNWLNLSFGPLTLNRAVWANQTGANAPELMVASSSAGTAAGAYSIPGTSPAVNSGSNTGLPATTAHDFFGNARARTNSDPADIGAVECQGNCPGQVLISVGVGPGSLAFGNVIQGSASTAQNVTLTNNGNGTMTGITLTFTGPYARSGGSCPAAPFSLNAGANCTVGVVFQPNVLGSLPGSLAVAGGVGTVTGSPVTLTGTGVPVPTRPTLGVLDNFNRAASTNLGVNWSQPLSGTNAALKISSSPTNQALCTAAPGFAGLLINCTLNGAMWNGAGNVFGNKQAAAFMVTSGISGDRLILKASGGNNNTPQNYVRIELGGNSVTVATIGGTTSSTTLTNGNSTFAVGDVLTALVDANGLVTVWKNSTYVGSVALPNDALWTTGGGRIGMQVPNNQRVDDFAGGTVP